MRLRWLMRATLHLAPAEPTRDFPRSAEDRYGAALKAAAGRAEVLEHPAAERATRLGKTRLEPRTALTRGVRALLREQAEDGSCEGEVIWYPMLAAQYVLACHVMGEPIDPVRRERLLLHFARTRLPDGTWGLHELSQPYLFVTTLVYVAARLLGVPTDDTLVATGLRRSSGKKAARPRSRAGASCGSRSSGLYEWEGVPKVLPEAWLLPRWLGDPPVEVLLPHAVHLPRHGASSSRRSGARPRRRSCSRCATSFTRKGLARSTSPRRAADARGRSPHAVEPGARIGVSGLRGRRSPAASGDHGRACSRRSARRSATSCARRGHTGIVAGERAPRDRWRSACTIRRIPDLREWRCERFEGWIWEDDVDGARVAGARSATWDTCFAAQALVAAAPHVDVSRGAHPRGSIPRGSADPRNERDRGRRTTGSIRRGGYCFAGVWHGWPVSDCTAEAMLARLESPNARASAEDDGGGGALRAPVPEPGRLVRQLRGAPRRPARSNG